MKWIKKRHNFLSEAKIRDVILKKQAQRLADKWGSKFLDYEEVEPTKKIKQGKWKLSEEDKNLVLSAFFSAGRGKVDVAEVQKKFETLPEKFAEIASQSLSTIGTLNTSGNKNLERAKEVLQEFDIRNPSIDEMVAIFEPVFRKLSNETGRAEMIQKDETGRPVMGEDGRPIKISKEIGEPVFEKNLINIYSFVENYNTYYPEHNVESDVFNSSDLSGIVNLAKDDINGEYKTSFKIFGRDMYLKISHNPKDILNMSISKFYTSCQHLYTGMYSSKVLGNVFDPNSIPAFLVFDTPIYNGDEMISEQLPLSRMIIRNIETFDDSSETKLLFDRAYPDRMKDGNWGDVFSEIVTKYTEMKGMDDPYGSTYLYTPDIAAQDEDDIENPYMDQNKSLQKAKYIGVNTKKLYLSMAHDWSQTKVAPNAKIKELIIENPEIPANLMDIKLDLEWVKFKLINISSLSGFENLDSDSIAFDKCKLSNEELKGFCEGKKVKRLQLTSCDIDDLNLSGLDVEELQLVYVVDGDLKQALGDAKFGKLVVSGDLLSNKENKEFIAELKKAGKKVETTGLVI
jgi:hypothetical protein